MVHIAVRSYFLVHWGLILFGVESLIYKMGTLNPMTFKIPSALNFYNWLFLVLWEAVGEEEPGRESEKPPGK